MKRDTNNHNGSACAFHEGSSQMVDTFFHSTRDGSGAPTQNVQQQEQLPHRTGTGKRRVGGFSPSVAPFALDTQDPTPQQRRTLLGRGGVEAMRRNRQDQMNLSCNEYPDPPPVGVRAPLRHVVRPGSAKHQEQSTTCIDEDTLRRAKARCPQSAQQRMPSFIFGEDPQGPRRTGRAMHAQSYKPTSLW